MAGPPNMTLFCHCMVALLQCNMFDFFLVQCTNMLCQFEGKCTHVSHTHTQVCRGTPCPVLCEPLKGVDTHRHVSSLTGPWRLRSRKPAECIYYGKCLIQPAFPTSWTPVCLQLCVSQSYAVEITAQHRQG